jgi:hypothetical protein
MTRSIEAFGRWGGRMRPPLREREDLSGEPLQNFLAQFLRLAEEFLVFEEDAIQFE